MALRFIESSKLPTRWGTFDIHGFEDPFKGKEHIAITMGDCAEDEQLLIRLPAVATRRAIGSLIAFALVPEHRAHPVLTKDLHAG